MYLLLNGEEKIIVNTIQEMNTIGIDFKKYKIYSLASVDPSELVNDGQIRDTICHFLKGDQITKKELIEKVVNTMDIQKSKVSKVIAKMKKEKVIYDVDDWNYLGERFIGMD